MNSLIALCLLALVGVCHSNPAPYGYGLSYYPAISTAHVVKAAPVPIIRTAAVAPIIAPAVTTVPVLRTVGLGHGGYYGGYGYGHLGYGGLGYGSLGYGYGKGYGLGWGGYGWGSKIYG